MDRQIACRFQQLAHLVRVYDGNFSDLVDYLSAKAPEMFVFVCENYEFVKDYWLSVRHV